MTHVVLLNRADFRDMLAPEVTFLCGSRRSVLSLLLRIENTEKRGKRLVTSLMGVPVLSVHFFIPFVDCLSWFFQLKLGA